MRPELIIEALAGRDGRLPKTALAAADRQREELLPLFLDFIDRLAAMSVEEVGDCDDALAFFFIFHLLGHWRERRAYRPLAALLRGADDDKIDYLLGDASTETSHRVMAAVFDGDPQPLYDIILDPEAEPFTRSSMCEALAMVTLDGALERRTTEHFLRDAFAELRPQNGDPVWNGWQSAIALLGLKDLRSLVKKAFERGYIDPMVMRYEHFLADLESGVKAPQERRRSGGGTFTLIGDPVEEFKDWAAFRPTTRDAARDATMDPLEFRRPEPAVNPYKGVGRNDPCPCGSGKKFKRCCLA